jgi:hypothetical protein
VSNRFCHECGTPDPGRFCPACGSPQRGDAAGSNEFEFAASTHSVAPERAGVSGFDLWGARIERALSIRLGCLSLFAALIAGTGAGLLWEPLAVPVMIIVGALCWLGAVLNDEQMAKCDACRKRVKFGAMVCHHCGYSRTSV